MHSQHKSTNRLLKQSIDAIESGHRSQARDLLTQLLRQNEENAHAWYYLARTVDDDSLRWKFLRRAIAIDPDHTPARKLIERVFVNLLERYVEKLEGESNRQQQLIDQRARELNALQAEYERLEGNVEALETQREEEQQKLSDLRTKINQGTARLAELKAAQQKCDSVIADRRRRVDHLRDQARSLEERIAQHQTTITELRKRRENLQADIRQQEQTIQELEAAQAEWENTVAEQERRGDHLQDQIEQMERDVDALQREIDHKNEVIEKLETTKSLLAGDIARKEELVSALRNRLETLEDEAGEYKACISQLEQEVSELDRQIEQKESKLAAIETIKPKAEEAVTEEESPPPQEAPSPDSISDEESEVENEEIKPSPEERSIEPQWRTRSSDSPPIIAEWETYLQPWIRQVELLGEIPISSEERLQLGQVLGRLVQSQRRSRVFRELRHDYPCSFAAFLTAQGTYGYDGRSGYWPGVSKVIGKSLNPNWTGELGRLFEEIVESFDLPLFPDMGGRRYVDLILAHGGIPDYCLPDFFDNLLQPAVTGFQYADMSVEDLIEEWLWHTSIRYTTDKPILRFLEFGGKVAQDFVARCREMAWDYLSEGVVPEAEEVGLPERVVDAYRAWIVDQGTEATEREARDRWRLRKPRMLVDPWGEGVMLDLPPQQVPATDVHADVRWHVAFDEETYSPIYVPIRRLGFDMKTEADSVALREPAASYQVSLQADGDIKRAWSYQGVDEERPLLVFDPERFTFLTWQHSLPARQLGLLYPAKFVLEVEGDAQLVEELPRMPWGWADFRGGIWDLSQCEGLVLQENGDAVLTLAVRAEKSDRPPQLVGGEVLTPGVSGVRAPVYVGVPPVLRIPLTGRQALEDELSRWQVTVRNKWAADPQLNTKVRLAMLRSQLTINEDAVELPLSLPVLLGEAPFGNFDVQIRGPLGYDADLTLRILPHLVIQGQNTLYLPDSQKGPHPVTLSAEVPAQDRIAYQERKGTCTIQLAEEEDDQRRYAIEVAPEATEIELTVERPLPSGETARVPFSTTVRRVRWALLDDQTSSNRKGWTGQTIKRPIEALLQNDTSYLLVTLPQLEGEAIIPTLRLLDIDGTQLQVMEADPPPRGRDIWRFDLSGFLDTIRKADRSPILWFDLSVWGLPNQDGPAHLSVLSLTQKLIAEDIELDARQGYDQPILDLTWRESTPLRHRHVRLWSVWRPWKGFLEYPIADDAEGKRTIIVKKEFGFLNLGKLRVEFLIVDPWAPLDTPQRPPAGSPATADIELVSHQERLRSIADEIKTREDAFGPRLERAFIYVDKGPAKASNKDIAWCISRLNQGTIPQILALVDLVKESGDRDMVQQLQIEMFTPGQVDRLLRGREQGDVSGEHFRCYLNNLPDSTLLPGETSRYLLSVGSETVRLRAAEDLIRQKDTLGLKVLLTWVEAGTLSDADAISLLKLAPDFSIEYLEARVENPVVLRLLEALAFDLGAQTPVVRPGTWVYTDAGWGRIERIETPDGQPVEQFMAQENDYCLYVILRPSLDAEPVLVDLTQNLIDFPEADLIYTCTKCKRFSSRSQNLIIERHDWVAHGGIGPKRRKERTTKRSLCTLTYSASPPPKAGVDNPRTYRITK